MATHLYAEPMCGIASVSLPYFPDDEDEGRDVD